MKSSHYKKVALGDIVKVSSGGTPSRANSEYWDGIYPWVSAKDLKQPVIFNSILGLSEAGIKKAKIAPQGSLLTLVRGMTLHKDVPVCLVGRDMAFNQDLKCLLPSKHVLSEYLAEYLRFLKPHLMKMVVTSGHGTGKLDTDQLLSVKILLPPFPEQKAIADLLSTWDSAIEKTERLIAAKEKALDSYGRDLFNRANEGKHTGWKVVKLKTVLTEHGDKSTGSEEVFSVSVHKGLVNQVEHLGRSFSAANTDNYNRVHYGDIVYTKSPTGDFPLGIVKQSYTPEDVIVSPLYGVFTPKSFELGVALDFYFSSPTRARNYLFPIIQKGAKNTIAITNKTFLSKALHLPVEADAQKKLSQFLIAAKNEIVVLKKLAEKYKEQKRGLMQKLLTGEWRVNVK